MIEDRAVTDWRDEALQMVGFWRALTGTMDLGRVRLSDWPRRRRRRQRQRKRGGTGTRWEGMSRGMFKFVEGEVNCTNSCQEESASTSKLNIIEIMAPFKKSSNHLNLPGHSPRFI